MALIVPAAFGDVSGSGDNVQNGDNSGTSHQSGSSQSGDAIAGGQVVGLVVGPGGSATVEARNTATNASAVSGDVRGSNQMELLVGLDSVLGPQAVRGISNQLRSVGQGNTQALLTADQVVGPDGPLGPFVNASAPTDLSSIGRFGPVGPPGPVGPVAGDVSAPSTVFDPSAEAQPTGPPGPVGPVF
jgi:hypothetical protein